MDYLDLILLGIVIGSNNLVVSFALGAQKTKKYHWRIITVFGIFEFFIPLIGLFIGNFFAKSIEEYASIVGTVILFGLGVFTIITAFVQKENAEDLVKKISSYKGITSFAMGLSLDNLMVGFSMGLRETNPILLAGVIASFSVTFAFVGLKTGKFLSKKSRNFTKIMAGLLLVLLGIATYFEWF